MIIEENYINNYRYEGKKEKSHYLTGTFYRGDKKLLYFKHESFESNFGEMIEYDDGYTIEGTCFSDCDLYKVYFIADESKCVSSKGDVFECKEWLSYGKDFHSVPKDGKGSIAYANGDVYFGGVSEKSPFIRNGEGTLMLVSGEVRQGIWYDNELIDEKELCTICSMSKMTIVLIPCGHFGMCPTCVKNVQKADNKCPWCRKNIEMCVSIKHVI
jgi:hypothetical protein